MKKKFFLAGLLATVFLTSGVIPIVKTAASEAYAYPLTFDSANDLNAFDCYYSEGGAKGILCDAEELWSINDGILERTGKLPVNPSEKSNVSTLVVKESFIQDFILEADFLLPQKGIAGFFGKMRKGVMGANAFSNSLMAYVDGSGIAHIGGRYDMGDDVSATIADFDSTAWHNIRLEYLCTTATLYVDDVKVLTMHNVTCSIPMGYVGIQSIGESVKIDNFSYAERFYSGEIVEEGRVQKKITCLGDSITYGANATTDDGTDFDQSRSYVGSLSAMLGNKFVIRNYGLGMRTILKPRDVSKRASIWTDDELEESLKWQSDVLLVMMGSNDANFVNWIQEDSVMVKEFKEDYADYITRYKEVNPNAKVYVMTTPRTYDTFDTEILDNDRIDNLLVPAEREIAEKLGATVIDINALTKNFAQSDFSDGLHPSNAGYKKIAEKIYDRIALDFAADFDLETKSLDLGIGETYAIEADTLIKPIYTSSAKKVATVDGNGVVTAVGTGRAVISVRLGEYIKRLSVSVKLSPEISVSVEEKPLAYGDDLPALIVAGNVAGTAEFDEAQTLTVGEKEYAWTFTPEDDKTYAAVKGKVTLFVEKAESNAQKPVIADVKLSDVTVLSDIGLPEGYSFAEPDKTIVEGLNEVKVVFTPADAENYKEAEFIVSFMAISEGSKDENSSATEEKKGCGSVMCASAAVITLSAGAMFLRKRRG